VPARSTMIRKGEIWQLTSPHWWSHRSF